MQFLDLTGLRELWARIKAGDAKATTTVEGQSASGNAAYIEVNGAAVEGTGADGHMNYVVKVKNAASQSDVQAAKEALYGGTIPASGAETITSLDQRIDSLESESAVTITESAGSGNVLKVYTFRQGAASEQNPDSNIIGAINIPKDFLVKSGKVREISAAEATAQMPEGTKVLDFTVNAAEGAGTESHIIIPVSDLVDVYIAGNGLEESNNQFSVKIDETGEFLSVSSAGLKVSGVSTAISDAVDAAKDKLIGEKAAGDTTAETIRGAKDYADSIVAAKNVTAEGDSYVSATAANNKVTVAATKSTKDSLALADSALQGVDTTSAGTNVQVTLGTNGKNVTVSVAETGLTDALAEKADKVDSATAGDFAGLDANGNLVDSGKKATDFATAAQGAKADSAIQGVTGEDAVANSNYVAVSVEAAAPDANKNIALTSHANVTLQAISTADSQDSSKMGLAEASDVKSYVDAAVNAVDGKVLALDADLDASGTAQHGGVFVMSGVTQVDGKLTAVDSQEVEIAGAAATAEANVRGGNATDTLASLRADIDAMGGDAGSIAQQIQTEINKLDSDVNVASEASAGHVLSTNANTATNAAATPVVNVLTSLTITDGKISAATGEAISAIPISEIQRVFNS